MSNPCSESWARARGPKRWQKPPSAVATRRSRYRIELPLPEEFQRRFIVVVGRPQSTARNGIGHAHFVRAAIGLSLLRGGAHATTRRCSGLVNGLLISAVASDAVSGLENQ